MAWDLTKMTALVEPLDSLGRLGTWSDIASECAEGREA